MFALKVGTSSQSSLHRRFQREARALASIEPSFVPRLHASGATEEGCPYLLLEYVEGQTLASWLEQQAGPPPFAEVQRLGGALLDTLAAVASRGILHRDIKPENVLLRRCSRSEHALETVLVDFGSARSITESEPFTARSGESDTNAGSVVGTVEYLAPERIRAEPDDERSDVYSTGVLLYELAALRPPFTGRGRATLEAHLLLLPPRPTEFADLPSELESLLLACLAKDPARRPSSFAALRARLMACSSAPAAARSAAESPGPQLFGQGLEPTVILIADTREGVLAFAELVKRRRGSVVRQRGDRLVSVFAGSDVQDPTATALAAARDLLIQNPTCRAALHVAPAALRRLSDHSVAAYGAAIDRPETWLPAGEFAGVYLTPEFANLASASSPGLHDAPARDLSEPLARAQFTTPLIGREAALATLEQSLANWSNGARATGIVARGEHGAGKSRIAEEARMRAAARSTGRVIALRGLRAEDADAIERLLRDRERGPLAVIIDDAHGLPDRALEELESALHDSREPFWLLCTVNCRTHDSRTLFRSAAAHLTELDLPPLDALQARELMVRSLSPVEYPPLELVDRLCSWAGRIPGLLVELASALQRGGFVRRRSGTNTYQLEVAALGWRPDHAPWQWLAAQELAWLDPRLAATARICAVLGPTIARDALESVQSDLSRESDASSPLDAGFALASLVEREILVESAERPGTYSFRNAALCEAIYASSDPRQRERVHVRALEYFRSQVPLSERVLDEVARHAAASGERDQAQRAHRALGDRARMAHGLAEAEAHYSSALAFTDRPADRAELLLARAGLRYRVHRVREAIADLAEVRAIATSSSDERLACRALLEEATALDWAGDYAESAVSARTAIARAARIQDRALALHALLARGRLAWRGGDVETAIEHLSRAAADARVAAEPEPRTIALLLLACALVQAGREAEGEQRFDEVIALTREQGDRVHLSTALGNRAFLWAARGATHNAIADLARAAQLAREVGNPWPERNATINLAEILHWNGDDGEALRLARRARRLEERFTDRPVCDSALLLARIHAVRNELEAAAEHVEWLVRHDLPDPAAKNACALLSAVRDLLAAHARTSSEPDAPDVILEPSPEFLPDERAELVFFRTWTAVLVRDRRAREPLVLEALGRLEASPVWQRRLQAVLSGKS